MLLLDLNVSSSFSSNFVRKICFPPHHAFKYHKDPVELSKLHWKQIYSYLKTICHIDYCMFKVLRYAIIYELENEHVNSTLMKYMGYCSEYDDLYFSKELTEDSSDAIKLRSIVASILTKFFTSLKFDEKEMREVYEFLHICFDPNEVCNKNYKTNQNNNNSGNAVWVSAWIDRAKILTQISLITRLLHYQKDSQNKKSMADEIKQNLIEYEKFLCLNNWIKEKSPLQEFLKNYQNKFDELQLNQEYKRLIKSRNDNFIFCMKNII